MYVLTDYLTTSVAWLIFNLVRFFTLDEVNGSSSLDRYLVYSTVLWGQLLIPFMMMGFYWLSGFYNKTFTKSRLEVLGATAGSVMLGVLLIYFVAIIDDPIPDRFSNYVLLLILTALFMAFVLSGRLLITWRLMKWVASGLLVDRVAVIGERKSVAECIDRLSKADCGNGLKIVAASTTDGQSSFEGLAMLSLDEIEAECDRNEISKVVLAVAPGDSQKVLSLVRRLYCLNRPLLLPAWSACSMLARVKVRNVAGEPLTDVASVNISESHRNVKRAMDVGLSALALLVMSPVMAILALMIKRDSRGSVLYSQERVGLHRKRFQIYKFRTMRVDAESAGPALSSDNDPRITRVGHFLRKYRLDELPQFWNVLKGDMSLVGPRPEREYYEEQILKRAPHYTLVHQVRPGLTSWGMVKYGYATSVDQMVERLAYDMIYLENISIAVDLKIMFFTVRTVLTGKGV